MPTHDQALTLVEALDNVSFFKVGLQLFMEGDVLGLIQRIQDRRAQTGGVFLDLKLGGDIGNTITKLVDACLRLNVKFLTLVESVPQAITVTTVQAIRTARGSAQVPRVLMVPYLSSLDADDLKRSGIDEDLDKFILDRARVMVGHGCDGLIVSGSAIKRCRDFFGSSVDIVSPGIRPSWAKADDQKRLTTPTDAIRLGADYLVVGRPIIANVDPRGAAQKIIDEIDATLDHQRSSSGSGRSNSEPVAMSAKPA